jgi:hypothetical protein
VLERGEADVDTVPEPLRWVELLLVVRRAPDTVDVPPFDIFLLDGVGARRQLIERPRVLERVEVIGRGIVEREAPDAVVPGSSVRAEKKLEPNTSPWLQISSVPTGRGSLTVASKVILWLVPAARVPTDWPGELPVVL